MLKYSSYPEKQIRVLMAFKVWLSIIGVREYKVFELGCELQ